MKLEKSVIKGDAAACDQMTGGYKNKLAASTGLFDGECPAVIKAVGKRLRAEPEFQTKSIDQVKVNGNKATIITHSTYRGRDARTRVSMRRSPGGDWIVDGDRELDALAPNASLNAYRVYTKAFLDGNGAKACTLSTRRGQSLIAQSVPSSHGGGSCKGAVPFLAAAEHSSPRAEVVGGEQGNHTGTIYTLQTDGSGEWTSRDVVMRLVKGKWLFDYSRTLGTAPAKKAPSSAVT
jgi:hypothetical protein